MTNKLEETLKKIEETTERLKQVMLRIDSYNNIPGNPEEYRRNIDKRDNLSISLNYLQNDVIIEQNQELIKYLNGNKK